MSIQAEDLLLELAAESGEICFDPGDHARCGHCDYSLLLCACRSVPHCMDLVLKSLPPPDSDASAEVLLQRFTSCVDQSVTMGSFDTVTWYLEYRDRVCHALRERGRDLTEMVSAYAATLPFDSALPHLKRAAGVARGSDAAACKKLRRMAHGATTAFIAGDWTCVTRLGCALLQNAFQRSDEVKYPTTDPVLQDLYHAIHMLGVVLGLGFSDSGWGLSIEARSVMSMLPNKGANRPKKRARSFL